MPKSRVGVRLSILTKRVFAEDAGRSGSYCPNRLLILPQVVSSIAVARHGFG